MSGSRRLVIREFALHPDIDKAPLDHIANLKTELGDGIDLPLEFGVSHLGSIVYRSMDERLMWLPDAEGTVWAALGNALRTGLPVPAGFIVSRKTAEDQIRAAYEELKIRERTHFVAVRGATHPLLNIIGPDRLIHTLRRLSMESADASLLVQRMIHSTWCGRAESNEQNNKITANEGMMILDPDTYVVNSDGNCVGQIL